MILKNLIETNSTPLRVKMTGWGKGKWVEVHYVKGDKAFGHDQDLAACSWQLEKDFVLCPPKSHVWIHKETGVMAYGVSCPENMPGPWVERTLNELLKDEET
jgi:hypothetical protein